MKLKTTKGRHIELVPSVLKESYTFTLREEGQADRLITSSELLKALEMYHEWMTTDARFVHASQIGAM